MATLKLELMSDTLIGNGEGKGATIDSDIVFDEVGLPYIPARRLKGCLRESAIEVVEMFENKEFDLASMDDIDKLFGKTGQNQPGMLSFSNCYLNEYYSNKKCVVWLEKKYPSIFSKDIVLKTFTTIRQQTAIDDKGITKDKSLRTSRVLNKGNIFFGEIVSGKAIEDRLMLFLALTVRNFRYIGSKRNRGFGSIKCTLLDEKIIDLENKSLKYLESKIKGA